MQDVAGCTGESGVIGFGPAGVQPLRIRGGLQGIGGVQVRIIAHVGMLSPLCFGRKGLEHGRVAGHLWQMDKTLLSFGHGYSARALAALLIPQGWRVIGTTRSTEKADEIAATGVEPLIWPGSDVMPVLSQATHVLVSAGPSAEGDPVLNALHDAIAAKASALDWLGYLSTTGVYGDHNGDWVDEDTPLSPTTKRGQMRKSAEEAWRAIPDLPLHIFRLAGIYGPGRGPFEKVRQGTARRIIKQGQVFSRTHVEDIAQVLAASIARPAPGTAYNVCDDDLASDFLGADGLCDDGRDHCRHDCDAAVRACAVSGGVQCEAGCGGW